MSPLNDSEVVDDRPQDNTNTNFYPANVTHWMRVRSQTVITEDVFRHSYSGSGTDEDPFLVEWIDSDPRNPMLMPQRVRWLMTVCVSFASLSVSFASTSFSGALPQIRADLHTSDEVSILSVSLYVLGFAIGPMCWGPMSELYGRQVIYGSTFTVATILGGASIASQSIVTLLILRFFTGGIAASALVNSAGTISDMFPPKDRGLAMTLYSAAPFLGPTLGPLASEFLSSAAGWRWTDVLTVLFMATMGFLGITCIPETYAPHILRQRARKLSKMTGRVYISKIEAREGKKTAAKVFSVAMKRPWIMLATEPIALLLAIYTAVVYGILYLTFAAFPIVFGQVRGWSQGIVGLSFLGIMVGQISASISYYFVDRQYRKKVASAKERLPAEERLISGLIGAPLLPIGLFWFAWTTYPSIPWIVPILGSVLFGFGQVFLFISLINYIVESYTVFASSALAANAIMRATFGAAFPLFTPIMYRNLGPQWASSIPAFLALVCAPLPLIFYKTGGAIRARCKYSAESMRLFDAINREKASSSTPTSHASRLSIVDECVKKEIN